MSQLNCSMKKRTFKHLTKRSHLRCINFPIINEYFRANSKKNSSLPSNIRYFFALNSIDNAQLYCPPLSRHGIEN